MKKKIIDTVWWLIIIWLLTTKKIMPNILILFLFFLLMVSILKSENDEVEHLIFVENKLPESRLLIDSQIKKKKK